MDEESNTSSDLKMEAASPSSDKQPHGGDVAALLKTIR